MNQLKLYIASIFMLFLLFPLFGQEQSTDSIIPKLILQARVNENEILLRWGVNERIAWDLGNKYGYIIKRTTMLRDGKRLPKRETKTLTENPIKPKPLEEWRTLVQTNDMAAVAAQAIYGESFDVNSQEEKNPFLSVINQSSELQQRFAYSMFAVDQNFETAQYAGLGFRDLTAKSNERYLYNIKMAVPEDLLIIKEKNIIISAGSLSKLPKPYDFAGYYYNDAFVLIWEYDGLQNFYNSYFLERSDDGINFKRVNKTPITKLTNTEVSGISYSDSIPKYEQKYWYRILGKTIFDEFGPASDTISLIAYKKLLVAPEFRETEILSEKEVILKWDFSKDEAWKLTAFDVLRAEKAIGPYVTVKTDLDVNQRSYQYNEVKEINYFKIRAHGIGGDQQESLPNMIQPIDSIPPLLPEKLTGTIDTLGIVKLNWQANSELDLRGYSIFKANRPNQEFTRLNKQEITKNSFSDTVNLKSFNKKVFYKIVAVDNRYNESIPSTILEIERPDTKRPTSPVFESYEVLGDTVHLKWIKSPSENASKQIIYRKKVNSNETSLWENIFETSDKTITQFFDTNTENSSKYLYTIVAVNKSNMESEPSPPLSISTGNILIKPKIKSLYSKVDRENKYILISWRYKEPNVSEIQLFRKESESDFSLHQTFLPNINKYIDTKIKINTTYSYGLKAIFNDGSISEWSSIKVIY